MTFPGLPESRSQRAYLAHAAALVTSLISVAGICLILYSWWWISSAKVASATVSDEKRDKAGNPSWIVSYHDDQANTHEAEVKAISSFEPLKVGTATDILYRSDRIGDVQLDRFGDKWGMGIFLIVWGAICSTPFWIIWKKLKM